MRGLQAKREEALDIYEGYKPIVPTRPMIGATAEQRLEAERQAKEDIELEEEMQQLMMEPPPQEENASEVCLVVRT